MAVTSVDQFRFSASWEDVTTNVTFLESTNCVTISSSDGAGDLISPETGLLVSKLEAAVFLPLTFVIGAPSNIVNMIVFAKQGLKDRVNLCLFSLALVDFLTVSFVFLLLVENMFMFTSYTIYGGLSSFIINNNLMMFYSTSYGSMFLFAIISLERCVCVLFPLQARMLLQTKNMAAIIIVFVPLVSFLRLIVTAKYAVVCFFDKRMQRTVLGLYVTEYQAKNKELLDFLDGIFYGFVIAVGCPIIVLIATVVTSVTLWQNVAWRRQTSSATTKSEIAVTKMLILLSVQFLVFDLPTVLLRICPLFNSEFSARGKYRLAFLACINIGETFTCLGMSLSFIVYYFASSRYREICQGLVRKRCCFPKTGNTRSMLEQSHSLSKKSFTVRSNE